MCYGVIYIVENKINGKIYVGQTTKNFNERYGGDISRTHNKHLKRSIEKHDIENFVVDKCICECDTKESLDEAEKFYIDFFDSANPEHGYNKTLGGEGGTPNEETKKKISKALSGEKHPMYNKHCSEETKQKLSESLKGKKNPMYGKNVEDYMTEEAIQMRRKKISKALKGKHHSEEAKQKMSEAKKGKNCYWYGKHLSEETKQKLSEAKKGKNNPMYNKHHSEETKQKMSEANSGEKSPRARAIIQLDKKGNLIRKWSFIKEAAKELNITGQNISGCCRGKCKHAGGFKWMYEEDYINLIKCGF